MRDAARIANNLELTRLLEFSDNSKVWAGMYFWRKKDAKKYLDTYEYKQFFEIVTAEIKH